MFITKLLSPATLTVGKYQGAEYMRLQLIVDVNIVRLYIKESLRENKKKKKKKQTYFC